MGGKSIVVTGSSGMIGTRLCEKLLEEGHFVAGVDIKPNKWSSAVNKVTVIGNICSQKTFDSLPQNAELLIHLAAQPRVHDSVINPEIAKENFDMVFNAMEFARKTGIKKVIFASSREVYGNTKNIVHKEEDVSLEICESPYTATKMAGEALVHAYQKCYGMDFIIFRFSNVYGMYDDSTRAIPIFINQCRKEEDLTVFGGDKILDFTFIDDAIEGVVSAVSQFDNAKNNVFNLTSNDAKSLVESAEMIKEVLKSKSNINVKESRTGEVVKYIADISKVKKILGYCPKHHLKEGIKKTAEWYLSNIKVS